MQLPVAFVSGRAQPADIAERRAGQPIFGDERAGLRLIERDASPRNASVPTPFSARPADADARLRATGQREAA